VNFIKYIIPEGESEPALVPPGKGGVNYLRWLVHSLGLESGGRVRAFYLPVEAKKV
jgi:hypothetical protein